MHQASDTAQSSLIASGIAGLDDILRGGFTPERLYLVEGNPGSGKTTLALQFLLAGAAKGEPALYVTLSETREELLSIADSHGWDLRGITIHEMMPSEKDLDPDQQLTMFHPAELELGETMSDVLELVDRIKPRRVVFDSLSELQLMAQNSLRYRRQILALKQYFAGRHTTVILIDDLTAKGDERQLQSIAHGVVQLEQQHNDYGAERRRLRIIKMRGMSYRGGYHDFVIRKGGLDVFPRLIASEHHEPFTDQHVASGLPALDQLLGGGLPSGSSSLLMGPAGSGKSTVALQFAVEAAKRGDRTALFIFDETVGTLRTRARSLSMNVDAHIDSGLISVQQVDPAELSPGEFVAIVRHAVDGDDANGHPAKIIVIDSLNGYIHAMPEERHLMAQMHELFTFLCQRGISTLVTLTQSGLVGRDMRTPVDTTYLADNVILFRYFEAAGEVRRAISVVKKRSGSHERTIRELKLTGEGIVIGPPLKEFQGVLGGTPEYLGEQAKLFGKE
jgi:circadian clock protein KaiC